jgi:hypothetical protein
MWPEAPGDWVEIGAGLLDLIERWRCEAGPSEILADFAARSGLVPASDPAGPGRPQV